jgi:hypothetical protein
MNITIRTFICIWLAAALLPLIGADKAPTKGPPPGFDVSGSISGMQPANRARMSASAAGKTTRFTPMAANGTFVLQNVPPGTWVVKPSHALYIFSPTTRTVVVTDHVITGLDFKAMLVSTKTK